MKILLKLLKHTEIDKTLINAHVASIEEIKENDYNLNIPRYVDTFEAEEELDLDEINRMIEQDNQEIAQLEKEIAEQLALLGVKM